MSHEGKMRRGKEEKERGLDNSDTQYYEVHVNDNGEISDTSEQKKKEKEGIIEKIKGKFEKKTDSKEA